MKKLLLIGTILLFATNPVKAQHSISGYIISLETAQPIANATIILNDKYNLLLEDSDSSRVTSDSSGFYKIGGIKTGTYIINAWTTYHALDQRYAMLISSNRIEIYRSLKVDFVFSENAFKYRLDYKFRKQEALQARKSYEALLGRLRKRNFDSVARRVIQPQIYIDSKRDTVHTWYIENIGSIEDN